MIAALEAARAELFRRDQLCEARPNVLVKLTRAGLVGEQARKERYFQHLSEALRACAPDVAVLLP